MIERRVSENVYNTHDAIDRSSDFVAHIRQEAFLGFAGFLRFLLCEKQLLLRFFKCYVLLLNLLLYMDLADERGDFCRRYFPIERFVKVIRCSAFQSLE